ncbi:MAG TPA: sigma-70 family RNA polymerase sigma factor [Steroidobacteraceae bacterium]
MATVLDSDELEELLRRCAAQDAAALQSLYARTAPQLLAILLRILRVRAAAEDALQDVFIRIWQQAGQFDRIKGRALSWMVAIARNRAIDLQRASRPAVMLEAAELSGAEQLQVAGPADSAEFGAAHATLRRCLELLTIAQRRCLLLAYQSGLTQDRIALLLGQPLGTVKSWVRRGLQNLRTCMES